MIFIVSLWVVHTVSANDISHATKPIESFVYTICDKDECKASIVIKNNTAFKIKLLSNLFDNNNMSVHALELHNAQDIYNTKFPFEKPIPFNKGKFIPYNKSAIFQSFDVKKYVISFKRKEVELKEDEEYGALVAIMFVNYIIDGMRSERISLISEIGFVDLGRTYIN